jgi:hypothetical protein
MTKPATAAKTTARRDFLSVEFCMLSSQYERLSAQQSDDFLDEIKSS